MTKAACFSRHAADNYNIKKRLSYISNFFSSLHPQGGC